MTNNMPISNKDRYRQLCQENDIPLFMQAWWMDAVCGDKWEVLFSERNGAVVAVWVLHVRRKLGFRVVLQPMLTQYNGIWFDPMTVRVERKDFNLEKEIVNDLIEQISKKNFHLINQNFHYSFTNWQPLYWKDFSQTTRYTYIIENISKPEVLIENFSYAKQKHLKKTRNGFSVDFELSAEEFYKFHKDCLSANNKQIEYPEHIFKSLFYAAKERSQGCVIAIYDSSKILHAALFIVWDKKTAYNLISAINPNYKSSGVSTRVVFEAIRFLSDKTEQFDFEGSMIEGVAQSFQQFGTEQLPYFNISKSNSKLLSFLLQLRMHLWK